MMPSLKQTLVHLGGAALGLLVFFSTDPTFVGALSDQGKWWVHVIASAAVYLGVVVSPSGTSK